MKQSSLVSVTLVSKQPEKEISTPTEVPEQIIEPELQNKEESPTKDEPRLEEVVAVNQPSELKQHLKQIINEPPVMPEPSKPIVKKPERNMKPQKQEEKSVPSEVAIPLETDKPDSENNLIEHRVKQEKEEVLMVVGSQFKRYFKYPRIAQRRGWQGTVEISFQLHKGKIQNARVEKSSGIEMLDESAIESISKIKLAEKYDFPHRFNFSVVYELH